MTPGRGLSPPSAAQGARIISCSSPDSCPCPCWPGRCSLSLCLVLWGTDGPRCSDLQTLPGGLGCSVAHGTQPRRPLEGALGTHVCSVIALVQPPLPHFSPTQRNFLSWVVQRSLLLLPPALNRDTRMRKLGETNQVPRSLLDVAGLASPKSRSTEHRPTGPAGCSHSRTSRGKKAAGGKRVCPSGKAPATGLYLHCLHHCLSTERGC